MNNLLSVPQRLDRELTTGEIHIWYASLDTPISQFWGLLATDEKKRAGRFHFQADRKRFIVRRGILRTILGYYLSIEPSQFRFYYGKNEKPALADTFGKEKVHFNLSHSEGIALYAFARNREIGVDIERIRDISEMGQIAERFFSKRENAVLQALPKSKKKEAFFNCWTRKEAFIKAIGDGLSYPLDRFDVSLVPGEPARLLKVEGYSKVAPQWSIQDLKPASGFAAALAVKGAGFQTKSFKVLSNQATTMILEKENSLIESS
jgi:4'-phosphopantetheinyl transferase